MMMCRINLCSMVASPAVLLLLSLLLLCNLPCIVQAERYHQQPVADDGDDNNKTFIPVDHASLTVLGIHKISTLGVFKKEHANDAAIKVMIDWSGLEFTMMGHRKEEGADAPPVLIDHETFLDLVIVKVPDKCLDDEEGEAANESSDCNDDWSTSVGIGVPARSNEPTMQYCCTPQARDDGACTDQDFGHLLFNPDHANVDANGADSDNQNGPFHRFITFSAREDAMDPDDISITIIGINQVDGTPIVEQRRRDTGELITEETTLRSLSSSSLSMSSSSFSILNRRKSHVYLHEPGTYMAIFANCHVHNRNVEIHGNIVWNVIPDEQITLMSKVSAFHISIAMGYCTLLVWFYNLLYHHHSSTTKTTTTSRTTTTRNYNTPTTNSNHNRNRRHRTVSSSSLSSLTMHEWILVAIGVGLIEALLRAVQYHVWAVYSGGNRNVGGMALVAMLTGAAKQALGRHVMLLIGLHGGGGRGFGYEWGCGGGGTTSTTTTTTTTTNMMAMCGDESSSRDSSSSSSSSWSRKLRWIMIIALSIAFFIASASYDCLLWFTEHYPNHKEAAYHAMTTVVSYQFYLQGIFIIAIFVALCRSMYHLKKTNKQQDIKKKLLLQQYRLLLLIVVGGILWTVGTFAWFLLTSYNDTEMDVHESNQMDFFVMLTLVAVVCRPNPQQQQASGGLRSNNSNDEESGGGMNRMKLHDSYPLGRDADFNTAAAAGRHRYQKSGTSFSNWDNDPWQEEDTLPSLKASSY